MKGIAESPVGQLLSARSPLLDQHGRRIQHLRISVLSACNLRCIYCQPVSEGVRRPSLTDRQRIEFVQYLYEAYGLRQVRITGGEPLVHPGLVELVAAIRQCAPDLVLAMTTNAQGLPDCAMLLRSAGLDRLNISLDTLDAVRYRALTGGELGPVLKGIDAAIAAGFPAPRLNSVILRGENDKEVVRLAKWALARGCEIRFLEAMPIGPAADLNRRLFVSADEIRSKLEQEFRLLPYGLEAGSTALRFQAQGTVMGVIGLIAPVTKPFCASCGRVRLSADGRLFPCLLDDRFADMKPAWADGAFNPDAAHRLILSIVSAKKALGSQQTTAMVTLGG